MNEDFLYNLIKAYLNGTATSTERLLVEEYYDKLTNAPLNLTSAEEDEIFDAMKKKILSNTTKAKSKIHILNFKTWLAAASIFILFFVGYYYMSHTQNNTPRKETVHLKNEIRPAKGNAKLTLANGKVIILDSLKNGQLPIGNGTNASLHNGNLIYGNTTNISYNTLSTEKGKTYHLILADGTQVWLDATSSIKFPSAFIGKERNVELIGQAYFEVAHNTQQPFKVRIDSKEVEVLGTHFNVNGFSNNTKVSLLEGSVKVKSGSKSILITPGEQAEITERNILINQPNMEVVMAWKNDYFAFKDNSMEEIFSTLSRWYDINVVYQDKISESFIAEISRKEPLSRVLNLLEMTQSVHFKIEGKKITIMK